MRTAIGHKLLAIVLAGAAVGASLLAVRQSRIQAASELTVTHQRIRELEEAAWRLRLQIARHVTPERLQELAKSRPDLAPIFAQWRLDAIDAERAADHADDRPPALSFEPDGEL